MTSRAVTLTRRVLLVAGIAGAAAPAASAHRSKTVLTTVDWNARTSAIEVTHRMHPHDAEMALMAVGAGGSVDLTEVRDQARLLIYVGERFKLAEGGAPVVLEPVGVEHAGLDLLVYQEARRPAPASELLVDDRIFRDVFDDQTNLVNIRMAKAIRTLMFAGRDGAKRARALI